MKAEGAPRGQVGEGRLEDTDTQSHLMQEQVSTPKSLPIPIHAHLPCCPRPSPPLHRQKQEGRLSLPDMLLVPRPLEASKGHKPTNVATPPS